SVFFAAALIAAMPLAARAQDQAPPQEEEEVIRAEEPEPTRLDVERLPPEAIQISRALYAHGFLLEATIGALGFWNAIGDYINPGPWARVSFGYELFDFLHVLVAGEVSLHNTNGPAPPVQTAFEI